MFAPGEPQVRRDGDAAEALAAAFVVDGAGIVSEVLGEVAECLKALRAAWVGVEEPQHSGGRCCGDVGPRPRGYELFRGANPAGQGQQGAGVQACGLVGHFEVVGYEAQRPLRPQHPRQCLH